MWKPLFVINPPLISCVVLIWLCGSLSVEDQGLAFQKHSFYKCPHHQHTWAGKGQKRTFYIEKGEKGKRLDFSFDWSICDVDLAWLGLKLDWKVSKLGKRWSRTNFNFFYERRRERGADTKLIITETSWRSICQGSAESRLDRKMKNMDQFISFTNISHFP